VAFRSILEARWALMFDELGWEWNFEPLSLINYIPDFFVRVALRRPTYARPAASALVLMEAKPIVCADDYAEPVAKIALSGWEHAAVVLCPTPWCVEAATTLAPGRWAIGMGTDRAERRDAQTGGHNAWHPVGINDAGELELGGGRDIRDLWRRAGNRAQWCPPVKGS
jgi:hypothetical protein